MRGMKSMRRLLSLAVFALVTALFAAPASADQLRFDPSTKTWMKTYIPQHVAAKLARKKYARSEVNYSAPSGPGSIVIDTKNRYLYYVKGKGTAIRYGIGVGRDGFRWSGQEKITRKAKWPSWTPPAEMRERERKAGNKIPAFMPGGEKNPLGARAMYLGNTLYRIHGTNEDWSIGRAVSSGCIRMLNEDVIDLYNRVSIGAPVTVL